MDSYTPENDDSTLEYGRVSAGLFFAASMMGFNVMRGLQYEKMKHMEVNFILQNDKNLADIFNKNTRKKTKTNIIDSLFETQKETGLSMFLDEKDGSIKSVNGSIDRASTADYKIISDIVEEAHLQSKLEEIENTNIDDINFTYSDLESVKDYLEQRIEQDEYNISDLIENQGYSDDDIELTGIREQIEKTTENLQKIETKISQSKNMDKLKTQLKEIDSLDIDKKIYETIQENIKFGIYDEYELEVLASKGMISKDAYDSALTEHARSRLEPHKSSIETTDRFLKEYRKFAGEDAVVTSSGIRTINDNHVGKKIPILTFDDGNTRYFSYNGLTFQTVSDDSAPKTTRDWASFFNKKAFVNNDTLANAGLLPASGMMMEVEVPYTKKPIKPKSTFSNDVLGKSQETISLRTLNHGTELKGISARDTIVNEMLERVPGATAYAQGASLKDGYRFSTISEPASIFFGYNPLYQQRNTQMDVGQLIGINGKRRDGSSFSGTGGILTSNTFEDIAREAGGNDRNISNFLNKSKKSYISLNTVVVYTGNPVADGQGQMILEDAPSSIILLDKGKMRESSDSLKISSPVVKATTAGEISINTLKENGLVNIDRQNVNAIFNEGIGKITQGASVRGQTFYKVLKDNENNKDFRSLLSKMFQDEETVDSIYGLFQEISEIAEIDKNGLFSIKSRTNGSKLDITKQLNRKLEELGLSSTKPVFTGVMNENNSVRQFSQEMIDEFSQSQLSRIFVFSESGNTIGLRTENVQTNILFDSKQMMRKNENIKLDISSIDRSNTALREYLSNQTTRTTENIDSAIFVPKNIIDKSTGDILIPRERFKVVKPGSTEARFRTISPMFMSNSYDNVVDISVLKKAPKGKMSAFFHIRTMKEMADIITKKEESDTTIDKAKDLFNEAREELSEIMDFKKVSGSNIAFSNKTLNDKSGPLNIKDIKLSLHTLLEPVKLTETDSGYFFNDGFYEQLELIYNFIREADSKLPTMSSDFLNSYTKTIMKSKELFGKNGVYSDRIKAPGAQTFAVESDKFIESYISELSKNFELTPEEHIEFRKLFIDYYDSKNPTINTMIIAGDSKDYFQGSINYVQRSPAITRGVTAPVDIINLNNDDIIGMLISVKKTSNVTLDKETISEDKKFIKRYERDQLRTSITDPYSMKYDSGRAKVLTYLSYEPEVETYAKNIRISERVINKYLNNAVDSENYISYEKLSEIDIYDLLDMIENENVLDDRTRKLIEKRHGMLVESNSKFMQKVKETVRDYNNIDVKKGSFRNNKTVYANYLLRKKIIDDAVSLEDPNLTNSFLVYEKHTYTKRYLEAKERVLYYDGLNKSRPDSFGITVNTLNKLDFDGDLYKIFSIYTDEDLDSALDNMMSLSLKSVPDIQHTNSLVSLQYRLRDSFNKLQKAKSQSGIFASTSDNVKLVKDIQDTFNEALEYIDYIKESDRGLPKNERNYKQFKDLKRAIQSTMDSSGITSYTPEQFLENLNLADNVKKEWADDLKASKLFFRDADGALVSVNQSIRDKGRLVVKKSNGIDTRTVKISDKTTTDTISKKDAARYLQITEEQLEALGIKEFEMVETLRSGGVEYKTKDSKDFFDVINRTAIIEDIPDQDDLELFKSRVSSLYDEHMKEYNDYETKLLENYNPSDDVLDNLKKELNLINQSDRESISQKKREILKRKAEIAEKDKTITNDLDKFQKNSAAKYSSNIEKLKQEFRDSNKMIKQQLNGQQIIELMNEYDTRITEFVKSNNITSKDDVRYKKFIEEVDQEFHFKQLEEQAKKNNISRVLATSTMKESLPNFYKYQSQFNTYMQVIDNLTEGGLPDRVKTNIGEMLANVTQNALNVKKVDSAMGYLLDPSKGLNRQLYELMGPKSRQESGRILNDMLEGNFMMHVDDIKQQFSLKLNAADSTINMAEQTQNVKKYMTAIESVTNKNDGFISFKEMIERFESTDMKTEGNIVYGMVSEAKKMMETNSQKSVIYDRVRYGSSLSDREINTQVDNIVSDIQETFLDAKEIADNKDRNIGRNLTTIYNARSANDMSSMSTGDLSKAYELMNQYGLLNTTSNYGGVPKRSTSNEVFMARLLSGLESDDLGGKTYIKGGKTSIRGTALPLVGLGALAAFAAFGPRPKDTVSSKIGRNSSFVRAMNNKNEEDDPVDIKYEIFKQTSQNPIII